MGGEEKKEKTLKVRYDRWRMLSVGEKDERMEGERDWMVSEKSSRGGR